MVHSDHLPLTIFERSFASPTPPKENSVCRSSSQHLDVNVNGRGYDAKPIQAALLFDLRHFQSRKLCPVSVGFVAFSSEANQPKQGLRNGLAVFGLRRIRRHVSRTFRNKYKDGWKVAGSFASRSDLQGSGDGGQGKGGGSTVGDGSKRRRVLEAALASSAAAAASGISSSVTGGSDGGRRRLLNNLSCFSQASRCREIPREALRIVMQ